MIEDTSEAQEARDAKQSEDDALAIAQKLCKRLDNRAPSILKAEQYYDGEHNLRFATRKYREAFGSLFREFANNYCGLIVDSTAERLRIEGFRLPTEKSEAAAEASAEEAAAVAELEREAQIAQLHAQVAAGAAAASGIAPTGSAASPVPAGAPSALPPADALPELPVIGQKAQTPVDNTGIGIGANTGDDEAWKLWQRNKLDLYSDLAHEQALITGYSYIMVGPQDDGSTDEPIITVEHPMEVITQQRPGSNKEVTAAVKRWHDSETLHWYLTLYLPYKVWRFESRAASKNGSVRGIKWVPRSDLDEHVIDNPFDGIVPIVPLVNQQRLDGQGKSELTDVMPIQDAVNKLCNDMLVAAEFAAFRQRLLIGMEVPEDEHGNIIPDFDLKAAVDRIMVVKDENVKAIEFQVGDLSQYVKSIEMLRNDMAAISRTPPQYLVGEIVNSSAEALKAAESGLVKKVQKRCRFFGESWEEAIRLAFRLKGDMERAESFAAETIWANPEVMTEAALADSLSKYRILGVPIVAIWEKLGASQTEIARWQQLSREEPEAQKGAFPALGTLAKASVLDES